MIKALKGVSARLLMKEYMDNINTIDIYVATVSENTEEQIRQYIKGQKRK